MLRALVVLVAAGVVGASCGGDTGRRGTFAGEGGEGGESQQVGGGAPAVAGASAGVDVPSEGGMSSVAGAPGEGGGAGAPEPAVSPTCGAGAYDAGEPGCVPCSTAGGLLQLYCSEHINATLLANGDSLVIQIDTFDYVPTEPLDASVDVTYVSLDQTIAYELDWDPLAARWSIDISAGPDDPVEIVVQPFEAPGACGEVYRHVNGIRFVRTEVGTYESSCLP